MDTLKKYLITLWTEGGHLKAEVEEYGRDPEHAKKRASDKHNHRTVAMTVVGEIA